MRLPRSLSGAEVVRALQRASFYRRRQRGSHIVMRRDDPFAQVIVPAHRSIDTGTLSAILDGAGLSVEEFMKFLQTGWAACKILAYRGTNTVRVDTHEVYRSLWAAQRMVNTGGRTQDSCFEYPTG